LQFDFFSPALGQVLPRRVLRLDQRETLSARPRLDLLFAGDCVSDLVKDFVIDEAIDVVSLGEIVDFTAFMLQGAPEDAFGYARVQRQRSAGHDVNIVGFL